MDSELTTVYLNGTPSEETRALWVAASDDHAARQHAADTDSYDWPEFSL